MLMIYSAVSGLMLAILACKAIDVFEFISKFCKK